MEPTKSSTTKTKINTIKNKRGLVILSAIVVLVGLTALTCLWYKQVNDLKKQNATNSAKIAQLEEQAMDQAEPQENDEQAAEEFVKDFYTARIAAVQEGQNGMSTEEADKLIADLEKDKVTSKLRTELDKPQETDPFFCVSDPIMSFVSAEARQLDNSLSIKVIFKIGSSNDSGEHSISADVIKSGSSFKFDSLECIF